MWFNPKEAKEIKEIPQYSGVYQYFDKNNQLLYVGKAKNLKKRVASYFMKADHSPRIAQMILQIDKIFIQITATEIDALILENHMIRANKPKYNIIFRDDKSYPYLKISDHPYPRLSLTRGKQNKGYLFGPYPNTYAARESLELLQKFFKLRSCEDGDFASRKKPCLLYQIKRCSAPCMQNFLDKNNSKNLNQNSNQNAIKNISMDILKQGAQELKDIQNIFGSVGNAYDKEVENAKQFLKGDYQNIFQNLENKMYALAADLEFEQAALIRNQISQLNELFKQQNMDIKKNWDVDVIAFAYTAPYLTIAVGVIRAGRHLGHKIYQERVEGMLLDAQHLANQTFENNVFLDVGVDGMNAVYEIIFEYLSQTYIKEMDAEVKRKRYILIDIPSKIWQTQQNFMPRFKYLSHRYTHAQEWLKNTQQNADLNLARHINSQKQTEQQIYALKELLELPNLNPHIECFDISHTGGDFTKASCVVFKNKQFQVSEFRHFNLELEQKGDDYAAMRQALHKRYKNHHAEQLPDVLLVDGGLGQLNIAIEVMQSLNLPTHQIFGISKGEGRKVGLETILFANGRESIIPGLHNLGLLLLAKIRDQAHDYAVDKMRIKRDKKIKSSILDEIPGIGAIKRKRLLTRFGGLTGLIAASVDDLMQVEGISRAIAEDIFTYLQS
jgi:excinuclease ABC subunit C